MWKWVEQPNNYPATDLMDGDRVVLSIYESHGGGTMPEGKEKAAIAAVPELLEACRAADGFCINARETWPDWESHQDIGKLYAIVSAVLALCEGD